ncbi:hypothetical protein RB653_009053 [Dictyostelium firmibasis]|uniref:Uncharacterized protein n=1 Tax=Dictyostelium firmibasis TaxID=79012 RepID=A0AAN7U1A2_9MYCE
MADNWDKEKIAKKAAESLKNAKNTASSYASGINASKEQLGSNFKNVKENISSNLNSAKHTIEDNVHNAQSRSGFPPKVSSGGSNKFVGFLALGIFGLFAWKFYEGKKYKENEQKLIKQKH